MQETCYNNSPPAPLYVFQNNPTRLSEETLVGHRLPLDCVWNSLNNQWRNKTTIQYPGISKFPQLMKWMDQSLVSSFWLGSDRLHHRLNANSVPILSQCNAMGLHNTLGCSFGTSDYPGVVSVQEVEEAYIFGRPSILIRASSRAWWTWMRNWGQSLSWIFLSSRIGFVLTVFCNFADCKKLWKATPTHWVHLYKCKYKSRQMQKQNNVKMQAALECDFDWHRP